MSEVMPSRRVISLRAGVWTVMGKLKIGAHLLDEKFLPRHFVLIRAFCSAGHLAQLLHKSAHMKVAVERCSRNRDDKVPREF